MCVCVQSLFSVGVAANTCFPPLVDLASDVLGNDALQQSVLRAVVTQQMTMSPIVNGTIFFVAPVLNGTGTWGLSCTRRCHSGTPLWQVSVACPPPSVRAGALLLLRPRLSPL